MKHTKILALAGVVFFVVAIGYPQEPIQVNKAPGDDAKMQKEINKAIKKGANPPEIDYSNS